MDAVDSELSKMIADFPNIFTIFNFAIFAWFNSAGFFVFIYFFTDLLLYFIPISSLLNQFYPMGQ